MASIDFNVLHKQQVEIVRGINRSETHGKPLNWKYWGERIPAILRGWSSGLLLIAGQSNHGKSSIAISLGLELAVSNPHLWVLDFSLDDDLRDRVSKYVAILSGLSPEAVKMEYYHRQSIQDPDAMKCYEAVLDDGYDKFSRLSRLLVLDAQSMYGALGKNSETNRIGMLIPSIENIMLVIMNLYHHIKQRSDQAEILVILDALNDVVVESAAHAGENERLSRIGSSIMTASQMWGVRFIATAHARKVTNWRKPSMDDVYGASALKYVAKVITFVYNDYKSKRKESPLTIEVTPQDKVRPFWSNHMSYSSMLAPVLVWSFLKVKTSGLDGNTFLTLDPFTTRVKPVPETEWDYYETLLASSEH